MAGRADVSTVNKILLLQVLVLFLVITGFFSVGGWENALSPGLGGLIALLANFVFAYWVHLASDKQPREMHRFFYFAEAVKIFLTVLLFSIFFQVPGVQLVTLMLGYAAVLSVHWFALILWRNY